MSKINVCKAIIIGIISLTSLPQAIAQGFNPEQTGTLSQVDITQGMAEQSAMYAVNTGLVPLPSPQFSACSQQQAPLAGYANQNYAGSTCYNQATPLQPAQTYQSGANNGVSSGPHPGTVPGSGISSQMVGLMGAALLMNYAGNAGAANLLGEMRSRGFSNRFHTFGSCIGGNVYH